MHPTEEKNPYDILEGKSHFRLLEELHTWFVNIRWKSLKLLLVKKDSFQATRCKSENLLCIIYHSKSNIPSGFLIDGAEIMWARNVDK